MRALGIDIGSTSIKLVEVGIIKNALHVLNYHEIPLNLSLTTDTTLEILEILKSLTVKFPPAKYRFAACLNQDKVSIRQKTFPFSDRIKILKSLPFELEEDLPFDPDNLVYDSKIIKTLGTNAEVIAIASPKENVKRVLDVFKGAQFPVHVISIEGLALGACFERWNEPPQALPPPSLEIEEKAVLRQVKAILHIGHTHSVITFIEEQEVITTRSLQWGTSKIAESISRRYEVPLVEAYNQLQRKAFILPNKEGSTYDQVVFSDTIMQASQELGQEIKITLLEIQSLLNLEVKHILISGGGSLIINFNAYLTQMLEVPVNRLSFAASPMHIHLELTPRIEASFPIALGLAIEAVKKPRNPPCNLLKGEFLKDIQGASQNFFKQWGGVLKIATASFVVFFIYSLVRLDFSTSVSEKATDALKMHAKNIAQIQKPSVEQVKKYLKDKRILLAESRNIAQIMQLNSAIEVLKKINEALPSRSRIKLLVTKLTIVDDEAMIRGTVSSAAELNLLKNVLTSLAVDGKVQPDVDSKNAAATMPGIIFGLKFRVDRGVLNKR